MVNVRNGGTFGFLADEAVIEVPAVIGSAGPVPVPTAPLPPLLRGLVGHVSAYEELAVDAALRGGSRAGGGRAARAPAHRAVRLRGEDGRPADRGECTVPVLGMRQT